jgi:tetratricopeptide (TPR) repeat protein
MPAPTIRCLKPGEDDQPTKILISEEEEESTEPAEQEEKRSPKAKANQFLELSSNLRIVECDDGAARRAAAAASVAGRSSDISLSSGKLVETADGLFGAEEVAEDKNAEATKAAQAAAWLKETSGKIKMPPIWPAVMEAKEHAAVRFRDGDLATARDLTTAALSAIEIISRKLEMGEACLLHASPPPQEAPAEAKGSLAPEVVPEDEIDNMKGILHSNRALLLLRQVDDEDAEVLEYGRDAAFRLILNDADEALTRDSQNYKASYRRALALFELGELDEALENATKVVEYYAKTSSEPNPEAVALREKVQTAIKEERKMWGQRGPRNWNRGVECVPVSEAPEPQTQTSKSIRRVEAPAMPWEKPVSREPRQIPVVQRELAPPKNSADVEKALMSTLKRDEAKQVEYVEKHLNRQTAKKIFKKTPVGPDLLAVLIKVLLKVSENSTEKAAEILNALGALPSASTYAAMLDASELQSLRVLVTKLGPEAAKPWEETLDPKKESDDMD